MTDVWQDDAPRTSRAAKIIVITLLVIGIPLLLLVGAGVYMAVTESPEQKFDREVKDTPAVGAFALPLKKFYPEEYNTMRRATLAVAAKGGDGAAFEKAGSQFFEGFMVRHAHEIIMAPPEKLAIYTKALGAAYEAGISNPKLCSAFVETTPMGDSSNDKSIGEVLGKLGGAYVEAAAAGRDHPVARSAASNADKLVLVRKLQAKGIEPTELQSFGQHLPGRDFRRACTVLTEMVHAIEAMPTSVRTAGGDDGRAAIGAPRSGAERGKPLRTCEMRG